MDSNQLDRSILGAQAQDRITGFKGTVTGICLYISGCHQVLVVPRCKDDGSKIDGAWIDVQRMELLGEDRFQLDNAKASGSDRSPDRTF